MGSRQVVLHPLSTSNHNLSNTVIPSILVVLHPLSTSNHNKLYENTIKQIVVLHPLSTSNHNRSGETNNREDVVLHPLSTSNHNRPLCGGNREIVVLHPLSTSNHNPRTPDTLIFGHLTASRHDTKRGGVHRGSRFDAVFTFSTNIRKIIFTEIRRCMSVQRAGARLRSDSSEANI